MFFNINHRSLLENNMVLYCFVVTVGDSFENGIWDVTDRQILSENFVSNICDYKNQYAYSYWINFMVMWR